MSEEIKNQEDAGTDPNLNLNMDDLVAIIRKYMKESVVGSLIEYVLASLLKVPVETVRSTIDSTIKSNIMEVSEFLYKEPVLQTKLLRRGDGWYGKVMGIGDINITDYDLVDVRGDEGTFINGRTSIPQDGIIDIVNRNPPYNRNEKITWNFAFYLKDAEEKINGTDFSMPEHDDEVANIIVVSQGDLKVPDNPDTQPT